MKTVLISLIILVIIFSPLHSQITIQSEDFPSNFGYQQKEYDYLNTEEGIEYEIAAPGGSYTWSFSLDNYPEGDIYNLILKEPPEEFNEYFPTATYSMFVENNEISLYSFFNKTGSELLFLGGAFDFFGQPVVLVEIPPQIWLKFPLSMGVNWTSSSLDTMDLGTGIIAVTQTDIDASVDAFGTITVPLGTYECLRVKVNYVVKRDSYMDGTLLNSATDEYTMYRFLSDTKGYVAFIIERDVDGLVKVTEVSFSLPVGTDVENPYNMSELSINNFPNPFSESTTINYTLDNPAFVNIIIYDNLGSKITTLVNEYQEIGSHQAIFDAMKTGNSLPQGIYYYTIQIDQQIERGKLLLIR